MATIVHLRLQDFLPKKRPECVSVGTLELDLHPAIVSAVLDAVNGLCSLLVPAIQQLQTRLAEMEVHHAVEHLDATPDCCDVTEQRTSSASAPALDKVMLRSPSSEIDASLARSTEVVTWAPPRRARRHKRRTCTSYATSSSSDLLNAEADGIWASSPTSSTPCSPSASHDAAPDAVEVHDECSLIDMHAELSFTTPTHLLPDALTAVAPAAPLLHECEWAEYEFSHMADSITGDSSSTHTGGAVSHSGNSTLANVRIESDKWMLSPPSPPSSPPSPGTLPELVDLRDDDVRLIGLGIAGTSNDNLTPTRRYAEDTLCIGYEDDFSESEFVSDVTTPASPSCTPFSSPREGKPIGPHRLRSSAQPFIPR